MTTKQLLGSRPKILILTPLGFTLTASAILILVTQYSTIVNATSDLEGEGAGGVYSRIKIRLDPDDPHVQWLSASPELYGFDDTNLEKLTSELAGLRIPPLY